MSRHLTYSFFFFVLFSVFCLVAFLPEGALAAVSAEDMAEIREALAVDIARTQTNLDHVWTMVAAALVFLMQAGFLLLEAGLVRSKNSINVAQKNIADFVIATCVFYLFGFGLMFGPSNWGFFGEGPFGWNRQEDWEATFFVFQLVFCGTAATIVSGAVAERMRFSGYLIITVFISAIIYPVFGHWAWGNLLVGDNVTYLADQGFIDFAGSTVVHSIGGWTSLAAIVVIGPRIGKFNEKGEPVAINGHSAVLATVGAVILWCGWIGFNGGSTTSGTPAFAHVVSNTMLAGGFGGVSSMLMGRYWDTYFRPDRSINGVLAGLVAITAGCDAVASWGAVFIGLSAGVVVVFAGHALEHWLKLDDAIGAVPVHGVCGAWGTLLTGFVAMPDKLVTGSRWDQILIQAEGVVAGFCWAFFVGLAFFYLLNKVVPLRVPPEQELEGLNSAEHGTTLGTGMLQKAMMEVATGSGSLTRRLDDTTGDESGELAFAFNLLMDKLQKMVLHIAGNTRQLVQAAVELSEISDTMADNSREMETRAGEVAQRTDTVSQTVTTMAGGVSGLDGDVETIASGAERVSGSVSAVSRDITAMRETIRSIADNARTVAQFTSEASNRASTANGTVAALSESVSEIETVLEAIRAIADQTRMLALNANIEAARAGAAGKGFNVVAQEVKALADETANATEDIAKKIMSIRESTGDVGEVIHKIGDVVGTIDQSMTQITDTVTQQSRASDSIAELVNGAAEESGRIAESIGHVSETAHKVAGEARTAASGTQAVFEVTQDVSKSAHQGSLTAQRVHASSSEIHKVAAELESMIAQLGTAQEDARRVDRAIPGALQAAAEHA